MRVERFDDPAAFFAHVGAFLVEREAENNLQLGFRERLEVDRHAYGAADPVLTTVVDGAEVRLVGTQTPPYGLVLSATRELDAVPVLVDALHAAGVELPTVQGPVDAARRFAELWCDRRGCSADVAVDERIYETTAVEAPASVPGALRPFEPGDRDLVVEWMAAFFAEAMPGSPEADAERFTDERAPGRLQLWQHDARPVSLVGHSGDTPNGARVGPVYTPPELRGRGYASAATAALTEQLLRTRQFCFLYTDRSNPTSNSIYQRIGYRPVADVTLWRFH